MIYPLVGSTSGQLLTVLIGLFGPFVVSLTDVLLLRPASDGDVRSWLVERLKALCVWSPPQEDEEAVQVRQKVLSGEDRNPCLFLYTSMLPHQPDTDL